MKLMLQVNDFRALLPNVEHLRTSKMIWNI